MNIPTFEQQMERVRSTLAQIEVRGKSSEKTMMLLIVKLQNLESAHRIEIMDLQLKAIEEVKNDK